MTSGGLAESPGGTGVSGPISAREVASDGLSVVGRLKNTYKAWRKSRDRATGDRTGSGKAAGDDGREEKGNQMSKGEGGRNNSLCCRTCFLGFIWQDSLMLSCRTASGGITS